MTERTFVPSFVSFEDEIMTLLSKNTQKEVENS